MTLATQLLESSCEVVRASHDCLVIFDLPHGLFRSQVTNEHFTLMLLGPPRKLFFTHVAGWVNSTRPTRAANSPRKCFTSGRASAKPIQTCGPNPKAICSLFVR